MTFFYSVLKHIYFTVTNDLTFDQRMQRICGTLAANGYAVTLVGRKLKRSLPLSKKTYREKRLRCLFSKGKAFYAEYNLRLFLFLFSRKMDAICAIDLDTILPCLWISKWKKIPRIYDAHELFTEMKEVVTRPTIQKAWLRIEKKAVPQFRLGYTVSDSIALELKNRYNVRYATIRNVPVLRELPEITKNEKFILYQGAVNEARGFEILVPAMHHIDCRLVICGDGNYMDKLKQLIAEKQLEHKIELRGMVSPAELSAIAQSAYIGIGIAEPVGLNQLLALPNKYFDYIHAGLPQIAPNFPEYRKINEEYEVAVLLKEYSVEGVVSAVNHLLHNDVLYRNLRENCLKARKVMNWEKEQDKLVAFYKTVIIP